MKKYKILLVILVLILGSFNIDLCQADSQYSIPYLPGWPQYTGWTLINSSPALADLNGDGELEIIIGDFLGNVYAWNVDGTIVEGWPQDTTGNIFSSAAVADLDPVYPGLEVVIWSGYRTIGGASWGWVYAWHSDGTDVDGWPIATMEGELYALIELSLRSVPAIADIDADGNMEVISVSGNGCGDVYAWHSDGTMVEGWPVHPCWYVNGPAYVDSSAVVTNLDKDKELEIIVAANVGFLGYPQIFAYNSDGTIVDGWPITLEDTIGDYKSTPAVGDLDADGVLEIVFGCVDNKVYALHADGITVSGWPKIVGGEVDSSPAFADLDGDRMLEIIVGSNDNKVYAWHLDGTSVPGWPQMTGSWVQSSPAIADLDGDHSLDIIVGSDDYKLYAWNADGQLLDGFPLSTHWEIVSSPAIADLDKNGTLEIAVGSYDGYVHIWTLPWSVAPIQSKKPPWPTFHHDNQRTGNFNNRRN